MSIRTAQVLKADLAFAAPDRGFASPSAGGVPTTRARREALFARLADTPHLPSPPGIVLRILESASRLDCTPAELAAVLHRDAALCGKILKTINSALYGLPRSITSIERAVALLGLKPVRSLVLSLSLPLMQRQVSNPPPARTFWKESVAGAIIAHELSLRLGRPSPDDDLVAGLLRDIGMLALHQLDPAEYARLLAHPVGELAYHQCRLERQLIGADHAEVSAFLLSRWRLPDDITEAIRHHHAPERAEALPRAVAERVRLLAFASRIAQLQLAGSAELLRDVFALGRLYFDLDEVALTAFLEPLAGKINEFAALMELDIGACEHYPRILAHAAEELVKLTLESSVDKLRILEQKRQAEQETRRWREQAHRLRDEVLRDPLTEAFNRGCLEEELHRKYRRAHRRGTVLGLIFLDLDDFKGLNDRFGHPFGDRVLKETASALFAVVRHGDIVARYGGDEFCILVENTTPEGLRAMTDRLWQDLNERIIHGDGHTASVRASIGAVLCRPRTHTHSAAELLALADRAMYAAKSTGKNQITFVSLLGEADLNFLRAVQRRRFGAWLKERPAEKAAGAGSAVRRAGARFEAGGRLARRLGWLTASQLRPILREQRATGRRFDEICHERGVLTADQLSSLLALQLEPPEPFAANLVKQGMLSEAAMRECLEGYSQWLNTPLPPD